MAGGRHRALRQWARWAMAGAMAVRVLQSVNLLGDGPALGLTLGLLGAAGGLQLLCLEARDFSFTSWFTLWLVGTLGGGALAQAAIGQTFLIPWAEQYLPQLAAALVRLAVHLFGACALGGLLVLSEGLESTRADLARDLGDTDRDREERARRERARAEHEQRWFRRVIGRTDERDRMASWQREQDG